MLVLSRRAEEQILIGDNIVIHVVRIGPNTVKIGIDAPKDVTILRPELLPDEPSTEDKPCST